MLRKVSSSVRCHLGNKWSARCWRDENSWRWAWRPALLSAPSGAQRRRGPPAIRARSPFTTLHTGERLEAIYWDAGRYLPDALAAVNYVLGDFRTGDEHMIDPRRSTC